MRSGSVHAAAVVMLAIACASQVLWLGTTRAHAQGPTPATHFDLLTPSAWRASAADVSLTLDVAELLVPAEWTAPQLACGALLRPGVACALDAELITPDDWTEPAS